MVSTIRIGSINQVLQDRTLGKKKEVKEVETISEVKDNSTSFNLPELAMVKELLKDYADDLMKAQRRGLGAYLIDPVVKLEENTLYFTVGSKSLLIEMQDELSKLKQLFNSKQIDPVIEIQLNAQKVQEYKVFTPKQKFDALAKKNPALKDFENRFGLDFDA